MKPFCIIGYEHGLAVIKCEPVARHKQLLLMIDLIQGEVFFEYT